MKAITLFITFLCAAFTFTLKAETLLNEDFETGLLPPGWQVMDNSTGTNNPAFTSVIGHNGTGGNVGNGGHLGDNIDTGPSSTAGGYLMAPAALEPRRSFSLSFDIRIDNEGTIDDAKILIGNLVDGPFLEIQFSADGQGMNNDPYWVTDRTTGTRTKLLEDIAPSFLNDTWYHVEIEWTPTSGRNGTLTMHIYNPSNGNLISQMTLPNLQMPETLQVGFGTANDRVTIDNVDIEIVPRNALLKTWITTSFPLETNPRYPDCPTMAFPISKLDFRNNEGTAGVSSAFWNEGEVSDKENDQYKKYARVSGYILPPTSGAYTFYVAGRSKVSFHLSESESTTVSQIAATDTGGSDYQAWDTSPTQTSQTIQLNAGQRYYFELRYDENLGAFHDNQSFSAAWSGPGFPRRVLEGDDMAIYWPWEDVAKPQRDSNGFQKKVGTWITMWNSSTETAWWEPGSYDGLKYWLDGEWKNINWINIEHINQALNQIKAAGIDFIIFDSTNGMRWYERCRTIQMMAAQKGLEVCMARDRPDSLGGSLTPEISDETIWRQLVGMSYFGWRNYLIVDGKPVTVMYDTNTTFTAEIQRTDNWFKQFTFVNADGYNGVRDLWGWQLRSDGAVPNSRGMFVSGAIKNYNYATGDPWWNSYHFQDYNWLLARQTNPAFIIAGAWDDPHERNLWAIADQTEITDVSRQFPNKVGNANRTNRYDRVRHWISGTPYVIPGGMIRDGAYKMLYVQSGYALRLQATFDTNIGPHDGAYSGTAAYTNGCPLAQNTALNNIHAYMWVCHLGNNEYKIFPAHLGLPIEGSTINTSTYTGLHANTDTQRWIAESAGTGKFTFRNKATGKVLQSASSALNATIIQAVSAGTTNQQWTMTQVMAMPSMGFWNGSFDNSTALDGEQLVGAAGWNVTSGSVLTINPISPALNQPTHGDNYADLTSTSIDQTTELTILAGTDYLLKFDVQPKLSGNNGAMSVSAVNSSGISTTVYSESGYGASPLSSTNWTSRVVRLSSTMLSAHVGKVFKLNFSGSLVLDNITIQTATPYGYSEWLGEYTNAGTHSNPSADDDSDSLTNFMEYALGGNPRIPDALDKNPTHELVNDELGDYIYYTHTERTNDPTLAYTVETSITLLPESWTSVGIVETGRSSIGNGFETVIHRIEVDSPKKFIHLKIEP